MSDFLFQMPAGEDAQAVRNRRAAERRAETDVLVGRHGILTHSSRFSAPKWMAIVPLPEHVGMDIADIMAEAFRVYDEGNLIGYGTTRRAAVMHLIELLGLK